MAVVHAEIEMRREAIVKIDAAEFSRHFSGDRAAFHGTDEDFVIDWIKAEPADFLDGDLDRVPGVAVEYGAFNDECQTHINGVVPA